MSGNAEKDAVAGKKRKMVPQAPPPPPVPPPGNAKPVVSYSVIQLFLEHILEYIIPD